MHRFRYVALLFALFAITLGVYQGRAQTKASAQPLAPGRGPGHNLNAYIKRCLSYIQDRFVSSIVQQVNTYPLSFT